MYKEKILIVTGGGDCPGLNAVIRSLVLCADQKKYELFGSINAFNGLLKDPIEIVHLTKNNVKNIINIGGTILGTTNKGIPSNYPVKLKSGKIVYQDKMKELVEIIRKKEFKAVINIGGDGSQRISNDLHNLGINVIGIPKTIDNDLPFTQYTFGFRTAVEIATDAVDKLSTTAASHQRVMILEVMGRNSGWIALNSGIAGGADIILIPEIPFDINLIIKQLGSLLLNEKAYAIIVVAEGAHSIKNKVDDPLVENQKYGGIGQILLSQLQSKLERDIRLSVLGHLQRGGTPIAFDRIIATEFGVKAIELVTENKYGMMTIYKYPDVLAVPIVDAVSKVKYVDTNSFLVNSARKIGISFGDK